MTRLALLADVHGDAEALEKALRRGKAHGCEAVVCAGDLVGLGPAPAETLALLRTHEVTCVRGDHDSYAATAQDGGLSAEDRRWLALLPRAWHGSLGGRRVAVWHAGPGGDTEGIDPAHVSAEECRQYLDQARADVLVVGHTHSPMWLEIPGAGVIVNPGALLRASAPPGGGRWLRDPGSGMMAPVPEHGGGLLGVLDLSGPELTVFRIDGNERIPLAPRRPALPTPPGSSAPVAP